MNECKPTVSRVLRIVNLYYGKPGNESGGSLHTVLDDWNINDSSVDFCIAYADSAGDTDGAALARLLRKMSRTQRKKLCAQKTRTQRLEFP